MDGRTKRRDDGRVKTSQQELFAFKMFAAGSVLGGKDSVFTNLVVKERA